MAEQKKGLGSLGLENAIRLRWALRDIHSKRINWSPVSLDDLNTLREMGYIEMINDEPVITLAGMDEMDIGD